MTTRRRFLAISAAAFAYPGIAAAQPVYTWQGVALGARATLRLAHPDAKAISARVAGEISRLEDIFSLYRPDSALMELNRAGVLNAPPFELLECLSLVSAVYRASDGRFDPTVQPLWRCYGDASALGALPNPDALTRAQALTGWSKVTVDSTAIAMRPGMALTLNGIAQGYIADQVATMLTAEGLGNILIDTGEFRAIGTQPDGRAWPVKLAAGGEVALAARALATSAPLGTTFDAAGQVGHILDPRSGVSSPSNWREITVSAPSAALADAISTAACLCATRGQIDSVAAQFGDVRVEAAHPA
ncbi:FAD:protein FMN transferase [Oceaniglobus ichthyenteri]|uniref:FAD:protein FMN transferase n=1 Tax=Oceaniglobus ichthyenteri TaxID=2136177 RepID=UPI000D37FF30|nr:FAD:protein FMN transferase [Oceaniglobus ichthyenteri]